MKKLISVIGVFIGFISWMEAQNLVLQNNKYLSLYSGYNLNFSTGELGSIRKEFFKDFEQIQESKDNEVKASFLPRHSYCIGGKIGLQFNPHIYFALNVNYVRLGHVEKYEKYYDGEVSSEYKLRLKMDYLGTGGQLIFFHPKNYKLYVGFDSFYNLKDKVSILSKPDNTYEEMFFVEYYKERRNVFLGAFSFGAGYLYKNYGFDINCNYTRNAFLTDAKEIQFFNTSLTVTYYFLKNKEIATVETTQ